MKNRIYVSRVKHISREENIKNFRSMYQEWG